MHRIILWQEFWRRRGGKSSSIASSTNKQNSILFHSKSKKINPHKVESAALLIQYTVRRWLAKRWMMDGPILGEGTKASSLSLRLQPTQKIISEERVRNLQHEIETWQHRTKVCFCMTNKYVIRPFFIDPLID